MPSRAATQTLLHKMYTFVYRTFINFILFCRGQALDAQRCIVIQIACLLYTSLAQLVKGLIEYKTAAKARSTMRKTIFSKVMELDAGGIEKIGPTSAITAAVDAVEQMQAYFSSYLPSLIFSVIAPIYLFFHLKNISPVSYTHLEYIAEYDEDESEIAGLEFIEEILGTDAIRTPQEIVILTEHDELQKKCTELGKDLEFQVLKYDEQSLEWENIRCV